MANILKGKVALVTASSAGLGAAAARALASEGMRVVINYSANEQRADDLVKSLAEEFSSMIQSDDETWGLRFHSIQADLGVRADITGLVYETVEVMGRLDVVVSNGGWTRFSNFSDLEDGVEEADWDRCFNMNVKSHLWLIHAAKKHLDETEGAFITTASLAGVIPIGSSLAYAVTKAAQIHLVKSLATIVGPKIRCNSVSPAVLLTDWGRKFSDEKLAAAKEKSKLKRLATVEDVANQIVLFAKSRSVTGTNAVIDCGSSL
ncbi:hypothetical protein JMJ35_007563 [Cladonia borealis]|uniref:Uncharacterized protein n=1 Tax=Cladonia borealis TaxID=184061 RepID=A0AA39QY94_9LECA|nr:hypothetical protein JMJ35_007563 [Cladonia borealis]